MVTAGLDRVEFRDGVGHAVALPSGFLHCSLEFACAVTVTVSATDLAGNTTAGTGAAITLDTTADADGNLAVSFTDSLISSAEKTAVAYTVDGLDLDATATVTFTLSGGNSVIGAGGFADLSTLVDGAVTVTVSATDLAGNTTAGTGAAFTLDTTADADGNLAVSFTDSLISSAEKTAVAYTVDGLDLDATATVTFTDSGGNSVIGSGGFADLSTLVDGAVTVTVSATDLAGNTTAGTGAAITLDTTADADGNLAVSFTDSLISSAEKTAVAYTVNGLDLDATATVTFTDSGGNSVIGSGGFADLSTLVDGAVTVTVSATDLAGNTTAGTGAAITLDTTADADGNLAVSFTDSLISSAEKTAVAYTVDGLDLDATATVTFTDSGGNSVIGAGGFADLSTLVDGAVTVTVSATDLAGNTTAGTGAAITLDTTADADGNLAVSFTDSLISSAEKTAVAYTVDGLDLDATATVTFTDSGGNSVIGSGGFADLSTLVDGAVTVTVSATDLAGNTTAGTGAAITLDTTADADGNLAVSFTDSLISSAEKTAVAYTVDGLDLDATATVTFTDSGGNSVIGSGGFADLSTLVDGAVTVTVSATDLAGNTTAGTGAAITLDTTASAIITLDLITADNIVNSAESGGMVAVTGSVSGDVEDGGAVTLTVNGVTYDGTASGGLFSILVSGANLAADTNVHVDFTGVDGAGNPAAASDDQTYIVNQGPGGTAGLPVQTASMEQASTETPLGLTAPVDPDNDTLTFTVNLLRRWERFCSTAR